MGGVPRQPPPRRRSPPPSEAVELRERARGPRRTRPGAGRPRVAAVDEPASRCRARLRLSEPSTCCGPRATARPSGSRWSTWASCSSTSTASARASAALDEALAMGERLGTRPVADADADLPGAGPVAARRPGRAGRVASRPGSWPWRPGTTSASCSGLPQPRRAALAPTAATTRSTPCWRPAPSYAAPSRVPAPTSGRATPTATVWPRCAATGPAPRRACGAPGRRRQTPACSPGTPCPAWPGSPCAGARRTPGAAGRVVGERRAGAEPAGPRPDGRGGGRVRPG